VSSDGWIGVDLDGTLAFYDKWRGPTHIGAAIPAMLDRVKQWVADGLEVRIFTARVSTDNLTERKLIVSAIQKWCLVNGLPTLQITCVKDFGMITLWDDRAVHVIPNTGVALGECRGSGFKAYSTK
jgi:hypothetical protein